MTAKTATLSGFAKIIGRAPSYVTQLKQAGRLVLDGKRVDVAASLALIESTTATRDDVAARHAAERDGASEPEAPEPGGDDTQPAANSRAYWERMDSEERARIRQIERRKLEGTLVEKEAVDFVLNDFGATLRGLLENLPDRLAPQVYPLETMEETHAAIAEAVEDLQREMAETMKRRMEAIGET